MRLFRSLRALAHFKISGWLQTVSDRHFDRGEAIMADIRLRHMVAPESVPSPAHFNAGRVLLASIVGLAICCAWIWFAARACR